MTSVLLWRLGGGKHGRRRYVRSCCNNCNMIRHQNKALEPRVPKSLCRSLVSFFRFSMKAEIYKQVKTCDSQGPSQSKGIGISSCFLVQAHFNPLICIVYFMQRSASLKEDFAASLLMRRKSADLFVFKLKRKF